MDKNVMSSENQTQEVRLIRNAIFGRPFTTTNRNKTVSFSIRDSVAFNLTMLLFCRNHCERENEKRKKSLRTAFARTI